MARLNTASSIPKIHTHEGAVAKHINPQMQLRRSVMSCLLWENEFYENDQTIADRILEFAALCPADYVAALAVEARNVHGLRHAPLMLLVDLIRRGGSGVADAIADTIRRPDEMPELMAIYWRNGRRPLSKQLRLGLAKAFAKFSEYQLAKYDREGPIKLRDVLFLSHSKPRDAEHAALYKRVVDRSLAVPDTWEVGLSAGGDKKETFERLIRESKLGYMALLRNLRNMANSGCDMDLVKSAILQRKGADLVLPFRYVAAARACPQLEPEIDIALCAAIADQPRMLGKTVILVDVSGSMADPLSARSDLTRMDAAASLASIIHGDIRVFSFSNDIVEVPPRRGMAGVDAIINSQHCLGTALGAAVAFINERVPHDRLIVITDEQSADRVPDPVCDLAYMINVASARNGVGYGKWKHLDGFSEHVIRWIVESEKVQAIA